MSRTLGRRLLWGILVAALLGVVAAAIVSRLGRTVPMDDLPVLGELPTFDLMDQHGRAVSLDDFEGTPWIADFVFTRCTVSCPLLSQRLSELDGELPADGARLVSFSIDPTYDTPQVLARYAERFDASPRWSFLTGDKETIYRLVRNGFKLGIDPTPPPGSASSKEPIVHSTRLVLVDAEGRIRGYYDAFDKGQIRRLRRDAQTLIREVGR